MHGKNTSLHTFGSHRQTEANTATSKPTSSSRTYVYHYMCISERHIYNAVSFSESDA